LESLHLVFSATGEIFRVEGQHYSLLAPKLIERDLAAGMRGQFKSGRGLADQGIIALWRAGIDCLTHPEAEQQHCQWESVDRFSHFLPLKIKLSAISFQRSAAEKKLTRRIFPARKISLVFRLMAES
jgi:hypothetical protein